MQRVAFLCVFVGGKYPVEYVFKLKNMISRHYQGEHDFFVYTEKTIEGLDCIDISKLKLDGWWAKMALFNPYIRPKKNCVYIDLDMVICGDLQPLVDACDVFSICRNFWAGKNKKHNCDFGSCVMTFPKGFGYNIYKNFMDKKLMYMQKCGNLGDQKAIEILYPQARILQDLLPNDFFLHYADLTDKQKPCSIVVFAGYNNPHNTKYEWVKQSWI